MNNSILFCGFGKLGVDCLKKLIRENYNVVYIMTHREGLKDSVDTFAKDNNINYSYIDLRKEKNFLDYVLNQARFDYLVSINYRYILPKEVLIKCNHAINIHGSILPKYRGRTPHVWSIINGEEYSGVTCHLIDEGVDTGGIIEQIYIKIEQNDTGYSLLQKFQKVYPNILINSLNKLKNGIAPIPQDKTEVSYYGKRTPQMGYIDFYKLKIQIINFVRAQAYPYPGAYYYLSDGRKIIINSLKSEEQKRIFIETIGVIKLINENYYVRCMDGILKLIDFEIID